MLTHRKSFPLRRAVTLALLAGACSIVSLATPDVAHAADDKSIETVIVTGSNIRRSDTDTAAPVQFVTREDIDRTGKTTLGEYLQTLTADSQGSVPKSFGTGFSPGGTAVSLRGLGASSTLVLLNGRRIAPYGLADDGQKIYTDIGVIPLEAVERVEVLKEGASAIYGSDAIAGVINIILRPEFQGLDAKASLATSEEGDGDMGKLSFTGGMGSLTDDGYNVYFNLEGARTDSIRASDRSDRKWVGSGDLRPYGYSALGSPFLSGMRTGGGTNSPAGNVQNPGNNLAYTSLPGCAQLTTVADQTGANGGCIWDLAQYRFLTPEQKYVNFFTHGTVTLSDTWEGFAEAGYSHKESYFETTPSGVSGGWGYPGGPVNASSGPGATVLAAQHPDNPYGVPVRVRYLAWDVGPRTGESTNDFWRALAGVKGEVAGWEVETGLMHSESDLSYERDGFLRYSAVRNALGNPSSPLYPWRIGDNANLNTQALYDAISPTITADGKSSMDLLDVKGTRSLMELPGGALGIAIGAEYRKLKTSLTPQTYTDIGDIIGLGYSAYDGSVEGSGAYVELLAPALKWLELSAAMRYDYYAGGLDAVTPKFGVKFMPLDWLTVRGTYAEGFRVPNPAENGDGGLAAFTTIADPIRCPGGSPAAGGASAADCTRQVALIVTPNADLKPEESESYTLGLVFTPLDSTSFTIDAWRIKRTNEINSEQAEVAAAKPDAIRQDDNLTGVPNSGTLVAASADYINSASTTVEGVDVAVRQTFDLGSVGQLALDAQWSRISSFERIEADGTKFQFAGTHGNCDVTNCIGTPKDRINFGATWSMDNFNVGTVVNFRSKFKNITQENGDCASHLADDVTGAPSNCTIRSFYTIDLSGRWQVNDAMQLFGIVENVTDRIAPLDPLTYGAINYNPLDASGAIGRYFTLGLKYGFQ